ncbi:2'-5' RNA ligase family protein [Notoacmeibacter ruber]|uniref:2'-5' RNA ligase family protein n=1 Tax=Notoacmeibacter ruber TaxID=2670375 RepID=UPI001FE0F1EB|nr:2'-5' RNA ligase family protein [Notoacmeibacter ruber]
MRDEAAHTREITLTAADIFFMGFGCAYRIESESLSMLRQRLAERFSPWLTRQDRQPFRPHITIQNKVAADEAKAFFGKLKAGFAPFKAKAVSLLLWRYHGGPWEEAGCYSFDKSAR